MTTCSALRAFVCLALAGAVQGDGQVETRLVIVVVGRDLLHELRDLPDIGGLLLQLELRGDRGEGRMPAQLVVEAVVDLARCAGIANA